MSSVWIAVAVVLGIALVAGVLLLVFSHLFAVAENPQKKAIRECLPGINCGACGYKGCDDYADALTQGGVKPNLCVPGAQSVADRIGGILGVEAEPFKDVVAFVACNGHCEATFRTAEYDGIPTCRAASMVYGGANACRFGCLGFGDCAAACPSDAICMTDGIARVDTSRCLGCGLCAQTCPKRIITMVAQETKTDFMGLARMAGVSKPEAWKDIADQWTQVFPELDIEVRCTAKLSDEKE